MTGLVDFEFFHQMLVKQCCQTVVGHSIAQHTVFGQCHGLVNEDRLEITITNFLLACKGSDLTWHCRNKIEEERKTVQI
jgi:hypothetical protein